MSIYAPDGSYKVTIVGGNEGSSEVEVTNFPSTQTVSGSVSVDNFPATQPISGNVGVTGSVAVTGPVTEAELTAVVGLLDAGAYSDNTGVADGSVIGLLKGIYVQNAQIITLLTAIEANTSA